MSKNEERENEFTEDEAEEIVTIAEETAEQFEAMVDKGFDPSVMFEASLLSAALFACGTELTDEQIVEQFALSVVEARKIIEMDGEDSEDDTAGEAPEGAEGDDGLDGES